MQLSQRGVLRDRALPVSLRLLRSKFAVVICHMSTADRKPVVQRLSTPELTDEEVAVLGDIEKDGTTRPVKQRVVESLAGRGLIDTVFQGSLKRLKLSEDVKGLRVGEQRRFLQEIRASKRCDAPTPKAASPRLMRASIRVIVAAISFGNIVFLTACRRGLEGLGDI
jgi:hypothetical protein